LDKERSDELAMPTQAKKTDFPHPNLFCDSLRSS